MFVRVTKVRSIFNIPLGSLLLLWIMERKELMCKSDGDAIELVNAMLSSVCTLRSQFIIQGMLKCVEKFKPTYKEKTLYWIPEELRYL